MITLGCSALVPALGVHDSTVAIMENNTLKASISEERLNRIKHAVIMNDYLIKRN